MTKVISVRFKANGQIRTISAPGELETPTGATTCMRGNGPGNRVRRGGAGPCMKCRMPASSSRSRRCTRMADAVDVRRMAAEPRGRKARRFDVCAERIRQARAGHEAGGRGVHAGPQQDPVLLYGRRTRRLPRTGQGPGGRVPARASSCGRSACGTRAKMTGRPGHVRPARSAASRFLRDFQPVSIKMAKEQGLSPQPDQNQRQRAAA